jgi:Amt family ammonium transporter
LKIDDPVGAVPVHLACGIWGTLAVALLGQSELLAHPRWTQLGVQGIGVAACGLWTCGVTALVLVALRATVGLRVSPEQELMGISLEARATGSSVPGEAGVPTAAELKSLMGEE